MIFLAAKHLNFVRALDKCGRTAHYKELTETGNRASKVSGFQVSDCLRWLDTVFQGQYLPSLRINYVAIFNATTVVLDKDENLF